MENSPSCKLVREELVSWRRESVTYRHEILELEAPLLSGDVNCIGVIDGLQEAIAAAGLVRV